ncbi:MAG: hypothetical protein R3B70_11545 [Polyangiaceae bacterium]
MSAGMGRRARAGAMASESPGGPGRRGERGRAWWWRTWRGIRGALRRRGRRRGRAGFGGGGGAGASAEVLDRAAGEVLGGVRWAGVGPDPDVLDALTFLAWL